MSGLDATGFFVVGGLVGFGVVGLPVGLIVGMRVGLRVGLGVGPELALEDFLVDLADPFTGFAVVVTGFMLGRALGTLVGDLVVGDMVVGELVGFAVLEGDLVGLVVGEKVGVGFLTGLTVGRTVGKEVGLEVTGARVVGALEVHPSKGVATEFA